MRLSCKDGVDVDGERRYVTTRGSVSVQGGAVRGPEIGKTVQSVQTAEVATKWREVVLPRLKSEVLFQVAGKAGTWSESGAKGYEVELVGYRVWDPCDGSIVASSPASSPLKADKAACTGGNPVSEYTAAVAAESADKADKAAKAEADRIAAETANKPKLPAKLSPSEVNRAMGQVRTDVEQCFAAYNIPGSATLTIEIAGDGVVRTVAQAGDFVDTPTGECIEKATDGLTRSATVTTAVE